MFRCNVGLFLIPVTFVLFFVSCASSYSIPLTDSARMALDPRLAETDTSLYLGETGTFFMSPDNRFVLSQLILFYSAKTDEIEIQTHFNNTSMTLFIPRIELENLAYDVLSGKNTDDRFIPLMLVFNSPIEKSVPTLSAQLVFEPVRSDERITVALSFYCDFVPPCFWDKKMYVTQNQLERFFFLTDTETINTVFDETIFSEPEDASLTDSFDNLSDF